MTKLKGILLTQGMHGMISQVEGLARALDLDFTHHTVELNKFWKLFPPKMTPISQNVFTKIDTKDFDVIISCGRKSVIPSIYLKKNSPKKIINIHIQDPKVKLDNFNFVIAPDHDNLSGKNVFSTIGAIHYLTKKEIDNHTDYLSSRLKAGKKYFLLILGGPTKHYDYSNENILNIFHLFNDLVLKNNLQGIVIPSMRTPKNVKGIRVKNLKTNKVDELKLDGLFIAIGHDPATQLFKDQLKMDKEGYLITKPDSTETNVPGVYAAGDVKDKTFRQAVTAAGMGCMAALEAEKFLSH